MSTIPTAFDESISELSSRSENGLDVSLVWRQRENEAVVVVVDRHSGEAFLLDVRESDNALDMFHHPYAYAAHRHVDHGWHAPRQHVGIAA